MTSLSKKVIKSENIELVNPTDGQEPEFVKLYSKGKGDDRSNAGKKGSSSPEARAAEIALKTEKDKKEAYAKGYADGLAKGTEDEKKRLLQASEVLANSLQELDRLRKEILAGSDEKILNLVFSVSEKVINQEVSTNRDIVYSVLKSAVKQVLDKEGIRIRMNPDDYRYIMEINPGFISTFDDIRNMTVVEDHSVKRGGVIIETSSGEVDARLEQQLHEIRKDVFDKM